MDEEFWAAWNKEKQRIKAFQPRCTCGKKHPEKTYHSASCSYLVFWNERFLSFKSHWETGPKQIKLG